MIYYNSPNFELQSLLCLDCGTVKTGIADNFNNHAIAFPFKTVTTIELLSSISTIAERCNVQKIIVGLPFAYPEGESYSFIVDYSRFLQENLPNIDFIFWDETNSSNEIRTAYKYGRKGFRKKFYQNYDRQSASLILSDFIACNF